MVSETVRVKFCLSYLYVSKFVCICAILFSFSVCSVISSVHSVPHICSMEFFNLYLTGSTATVKGFRVLLCSRMWGNG